MPSPWSKVLLNRWSMMFFAFYGLFTLLVGILVLEQQLITPSYTTGLILGFLGISVLKIQITLFKPLTGSEGLTAKFDQVFGGIQQFCFDGLLRSLEVKRQDIREQAARLGEAALLDKLKDLIPNEMDTVNKLVDGNRETNPETIPALLVSLIERHNPDQLEILVIELPKRSWKYGFKLNLKCQAYHRHLWLSENALSGVEVEQLRALIDANQEAQDEDGQEP